MIPKLKSRISREMNIPQVRKDSEGFEDLDSFWNIASKQLSSSSITPGISSVGSVMTGSSFTSELEFDYEDTQSITDDEEEEEENINISVAKSSKETFDTPAILSHRLSSMSSNQFSEMTLNSTIPDDDLLEDSSRKSMATVRSTNTRASMDSITSEIQVDTPIESVKKRGRPPKSRSSEKESDIRDCAAAPIGFVDNFLSQQIQISKEEAAKPAKSSLKQTSVPVSPTKSSSSSSMTIGTSSAIQKQVSFETNTLNKDDVGESELPELDIQEAEVFDEVEDHIDYIEESDDIIEDTQESTTPKTKITRKRQSFSSVKSAISTPGSFDFPRGRSLKDESYINEDLEDTDEEDLNESSFAPDDSFIDDLKRKSSKYIDDEEEEEEEYDEDMNTNVRRSRRATKGQRLEYWKNERPVYEKGQMVGFLLAEPTPKKAMKTTKFVRKNTEEDIKKANKQRNINELETEDEVLPLPKIPKKFKYISRDEEIMRVWNDAIEATEKAKIVSHSENLYPLTQLPIGSDRPPGKTKVASAAQFFSGEEVEGKRSAWVAGFMELPPGAIKDAENVGPCSQVFYVADCQDDSLELGIADPSSGDWNDKTAQRQLLRKNDSFFVPADNMYRIENHSEVKSCTISWVIIKALSSSFEEEE